MQQKIRKALYFLSLDARRTTKELGQLLGVSQQSASYLCSTLEKKGHIQNYHCIIDPARFGLVSVFVLYNYLRFDAKNITAIHEQFMKHPLVTHVERIAQSADLLVRFTAPNLSSFNKHHREILAKNKGLLSLVGQHVLIVEHLYDPAYLVPKRQRSEIILSGDRDLVSLTPKQSQVLAELYANPIMPLLRIAEKLSLDAKTVMHLKKQLEKQAIIRRYGVTYNYEELQIQRVIVFIELEYDNPSEIQRFIEYAKQHKNIVSAIKLLGDFEFMIVLEQIEHENLLYDLRKTFSVRNYQLYESQTVLKHVSVPVALFTDL
ncbi:MAG: Lrp/AsnC family transcriptional regulator [Candidatus Woesearchaeota archaeon]|nr:MAG: Lrp/AsnC family transcriptional regulator [Candidatus Woesearchaeota archaeon]